MLPLGQFGFRGRTQDELAADEAERLKREAEKGRNWWNPFGSKGDVVAPPLQPSQKKDNSLNPFAHREDKGMCVCVCV